MSIPRWSISFLFGLDMQAMAAILGGAPSAGANHPMDFILHFLLSIMIYCLLHRLCIKIYQIFIVFVDDVQAMAAILGGAPSAGANDPITTAMASLSRDELTEIMRQLRVSHDGKAEFIGP